MITCKFYSYICTPILDNHFGIDYIPYMYNLYVYHYQWQLSVTSHKMVIQGFQNKLAAAGLLLATLSFTTGYFSHDNKIIHVSKLTPNLTPKRLVHTQFQTMVLLAVIYSSVFCFQLHWFHCLGFKDLTMSVVIHARVCSCFDVSFHHFEFCISSQSGQRSEMMNEPRLGVLCRETSWVKWHKNGRR